MGQECSKRDSVGPNRIVMAQLFSSTFVLHVLKPKIRWQFNETFWLLTVPPTCFAVLVRHYRSKRALLASVETTALVYFLSKFCCLLSSFWPLAVPLSCHLFLQGHDDDKKLGGRKSTAFLIRKGNQYKLHKQWQLAGDAFKQAAIEFSEQAHCEHDAANNYAEAANCYRKPKLREFTAEAVGSMEKSALIFAQIGEFSIAARHLEDAGDLASELGKQTSDADNSREAIRLYMKATDFWNGEDSPASAVGSRTKAALLMADIGMLDDAAREFEDLGVTSQRHSLLGFGSKDHMFKCCLCHLSLDASKCNEIAEDLGRKCDSFAESDEQTLVKKVSEAWNGRDVASFDKAVAEFERLNNLDDWSQRRLFEIRQKFDGEILV